MMKHDRIFPTMLLGILLVGALSTASADTIDLDDGRVMEGKVVVVTNTIVGIETSSGRVTLPRDRVRTPDLAKWLQDARSAMEQNNFIRAADLCEQILIWDPKYPGADIMQQRAKAILLEKQAHTLSDADAKAHENKLNQTVNKASRDEAERIRIAYEKATAYQRMKDAKMKQARALFEKGDRDGAAKICRDILAQAPGDDPQVALLLKQFEAFKERARQKALASKPKPTIDLAPSTAPAVAASLPDSALVAQIRNPATKKAVREIEQKLAAVRDYTCTMNVTTLIDKDGKKTKILNVETQSFKRHYRRDRSNNFFSQGTSHHGTPQESTAISMLNVTTYWKFFPKTNVLWKYDIKRLAQAKHPVEDIVQLGWLIQPFRWWCDPATLQLDGANPQAWVFKATYTPPGKPREKMPVRFTIDRKTGILLVFESEDKKEGSTSTHRFSDIKLNPGVDPGIFRFTPAPGQPFEDRTETYIQSMAKKTP